MEPKRVKKLVLNKETISNLSNFEQNMIWGGYVLPTIVLGLGICAEYHTVDINASYCNPSYCNDLSCAGGGLTCLNGGNCDSTDDPDYGCHTDRHC